jgi:hypothetical protein
MNISIKTAYFEIKREKSSFRIIEGRGGGAS